MTEEDILDLREVYRIPIPIIGVPIPGRNNPIAVINSNNTIDIYGKIGIGRRCDLRIEGGVRIRRDIIRTLIRFFERLSEELGVDMCIRISLSYDTREILYLPLYMIITTAVTSRIVGEVDPIDLAKSMIVIDRSLGLNSSHAEGVRFSIAERMSIAFRRGDEIIKLPDPGTLSLTMKLVRHVKLREIPSTLLENEIGDLVTKLVGYTALKSIQSIREGDLDRFMRYLEIERRLWTLLYDMPRSRCYYVYDEWGRAACISISSQKH
ncbi:MAG: hypothetical protein QXQ36_05640 [Sulfolobales archaeon]